MSRNNRPPGIRICIQNALNAKRHGVAKCSTRKTNNLPKCARRGEFAKSVETSQQHALDGRLQGAARSERFDTRLMEMRSASGLVPAIAALGVQARRAPVLANMIRGKSAPAPHEHWLLSRGGQIGIRGHIDRLANARYRQRIYASDERTQLTALLRPGLCQAVLTHIRVRFSVSYGTRHSQCARRWCRHETHAQSTDDSAEAEVKSIVSPQLLGAKSRTVRCKMQMCGAQCTRHASNMLTTLPAQST